jgi:hypothetical protein
MAKTPLRLSKARHYYIEMMRLMKEEELNPESNAHLPKERMDANSLLFGLGQTRGKTNDLLPEGCKPNDHFS